MSRRLGYLSVSPRVASSVVFERVGIVGSGIMAAGIAEVAAVHGHEVVLRGRRRSPGRRDARIDTATKGRCGHPTGPFVPLDLVGLDTSVAILDALYAEYEELHHAPAPLLHRMVAAEQLGRDYGLGFYSYRSND